MIEKYNVAKCYYLWLLYLLKCKGDLPAQARSKRRVLKGEGFVLAGAFGALRGNTRGSYLVLWLGFIVKGNYDSILQAPPN